MPPAPTSTCPNCQATDVPKLDEVSRISFVDYYRCRRCQHVWTADRGTGRILTHVTPLKEAIAPAADEAIHR